MLLPRSCFALLALLALVPKPAAAAWPNDPGVNVVVAPSGADQESPLNVEDGAGGTFVVWVENSNLRAQRLTAQGLVSSGWPAGGIVVCGAAGQQFPSTLVSDGTGGFITAWDDYRGGATSDIYAQRVSGAGVALWTADGAAVSTAANAQTGARMCADRAGGAVIAWMDSRNGGMNLIDIYAQRLSAAGALMWTATGEPICALVGGNQDFVTVASDGTVGGAYILWRDARGANPDLYASRVDGSGFLRLGWAANGTVVCNATGDQANPAMIADGAFGAIVAWADFRSGSGDIYATRLSPSGPTSPGWAANGTALTLDAPNQTAPALVTNGAGGAIVVWEDVRNGALDIYAQRINASGAVAWVASGVALTLAPDIQFGPVLAPDGAGGAIAGWQDWRAGIPSMLFAQHVTSAGVIAAGFDPDGNAIATAHRVQTPAACSDGAGGAIFVWQHNGAPQQGYAQRIDRWGYLGAQASLASVKDVPADQGGRVKLAWDASPLDAFPSAVLTDYRVFRSVPAAAALAALAEGKAVLRGSGVRETAARGMREFVTTTFAAATYYWESLATLSAQQLAGYSYLAATAQDSIGAGNPRTLFMVRSLSSDGTQFWDSDPDSGYSVDNLAPAAVVEFSGHFAGGTTHLHWAPNAEADFAEYRLYAGASVGFVPGPGNLVTVQPDTGFADTGAAGAYYKVTAVDVHGNESPIALLTPVATVGIEPSTARLLALAPAFPNPSGGATTLRFALPREGVVRLSVHDVSGRLVRVLVDAHMPAGEHSVIWDGAIARGRVPSGLYFQRLSFEGRTLTGKIMRVE